MTRNLVLEFIFYFVTAYMRKYPIHLTFAQGTTQNKYTVHQLKK